jgi:hypothetical protein
MSTQFLATTSKNQMKATDIKILGRQSHDTECEHTLDLIPNLGVKLKNENIMQLKLGHFYVVAENWVKLVYMCPSDAEPGECRQVAMGKRDPSDLHYRYTGLVTAETLKTIKKEARNFFIYENTEEPKKKEPEPVKLPDEEMQIEKPTPEHEDNFNMAIALMKAYTEPEPVQEQLVPTTTEEISIEKIPIKMQTLQLSNPEVKLEIPAADHIEPEKPKIQPPIILPGRHPIVPAKNRETPLNSKFELIENNIDALRMKVNEHQDNINYLNRLLDSQRAQITQLRSEMKQDQTIKISATQSNVIIKNLTRTTQVDSKSYEGKVMVLAKEGFFTAPRALRDVKEGLEKHNFTVQETETLKKTLYNLVTRELLCSTKVKGELRYRLHSGVKFATADEILKASLPEEVSQTEQTKVTVMETKDVQK